MTDRTFPILKRKWNDPKESIPWSAIEPHRRQAKRNHYQTLERLAERGGLSWCELHAVLEDREWRKEVEADAKTCCLAIIASPRRPSQPTEGIE